VAPRLQIKNHSTPITVARNWRLTHVVALARNQLLSLELEGREGAARGEEALALGVLDSVLEGALRLGARVGQGEDDGPLVHGSHLLENLGSESAANGAETHEDSGLDVVDDLLEVLYCSPLLSSREK
jgi:hypothetical protein